MEFHISQIDDAAVVSLIGGLDALSAEQVTCTFAEQVQSGWRRLVADLGQVQFLSSAGLRAIMSVFKEVRQHGGDFRLAAPQAAVERVLRLAGFTNTFKLYSTVEEAVDSFDSP